MNSKIVLKALQYKETYYLYLYIQIQIEFFAFTIATTNIKTNIISFLYLFILILLYKISIVNLYTKRQLDQQLINNFINLDIKQ